MQSRFIFRAVAPVLIVFMVVLPLSARPHALAGVITVAVLDLLAICLLLGLYDAVRFASAFRVLGAAVFVMFLAYFFTMVWQENFLGRGNEPTSAINALLGLFCFGVPGLLFAINGHFGLSEPLSESAGLDEFGQEDEFLKVDHEDSRTNQ